MYKTSLYTVGGTVQADTGLYIPRQADQELLELCRAGTFAYVLSPRQLGKSSLMVRTAEKLKEEQIDSVIVDLTQLGVDITPEAWYLGILTTIEDTLLLDTNVVSWWQEHAFLGNSQRLVVFLEDVLVPRLTQPQYFFEGERDFWTTWSKGDLSELFRATKGFSPRSKPFTALVRPGSREGATRSRRCPFGDKETGKPGRSAPCTSVLPVSRWRVTKTGLFPPSPT